MLGRKLKMTRQPEREFYHILLLRCCLPVGLVSSTLSRNAKKRLAMISSLSSSSSNGAN